MKKILSSLAILLAVGCYVGADALTSQQNDVEHESVEKPAKPSFSVQPEEDVDPSNCEDAYQILMFHEESLNADIIVLIPIPCDPKPFIDLGRPSPIVL